MNAAVHDLDLLSRLPLFRNVKLPTLRTQLDRCRERLLAPGEILLSPHIANIYVFVLLSGRLGIHLDKPHESKPIVTLERGECVGEMSFFGSHIPSAFVVAAERSRVLAIDEDSFWDLINGSHEIAINLLHILARRVRSGNERFGESEQRANVDALTGLHNRRWLNEVFHRESRRAASTGEPTCIAMIDVDHFKKFNDKHGHLAGDAVLKSVGQTIRANVRPTDLPARYGGEEFAVLLPATALEDGLVTAERVRLAIRETLVKAPEGHDLPQVTASFGVAQLLPGEVLEALVARADAALYRAKEQGRDRVAI